MFSPFSQRRKDTEHLDKRFIWAIRILPIELLVNAQKTLSERRRGPMGQCPVQFKWPSFSIFGLIGLQGYRTCLVSILMLLPDDTGIPCSGAWLRIRMRDLLSTDFRLNIPSSHFTLPECVSHFPAEHPTCVFIFP